MTCRECAELLMEYVSGELDEERSAWFRQHLERCKTCVNFVDSYQITIQITRKLSCGELPPDVAERLRKCLEELGDE